MSLIYRAVRVGRGGKLFIQYKFRTMAEKTDREGKFKEKTRLTPIGKFLRKYRIDEIPQLWNILKGEMSFMGPRPDELEFVYKIPEKDRNIILSVKPGMVDLATLWDLERNEVPYKNPEKEYLERTQPKKVALQIYHIQHRSFWFDLKVIIKVFLRIFHV